MKKSTVLSFCKKLLLYEFSRSLNSLVDKGDLSQRNVSKKINASHSWFNDFYTHLEDIQTTSLLRVLAVVSLNINKDSYEGTVGSLYGETLFNESTLMLANLYIWLKEGTDYITIETFFEHLEDMDKPLLERSITNIEDPSLTDEEKEIKNIIKNKLFTEKGKENVK